MRKETLKEHFRDVQCEALLLSRRHDVAITEIKFGDTDLASTEYEVDPEAGIVYRLLKGSTTFWSAAQIDITYEAGFATIPADLKMAAMDFMRLAWAEKDRDPSLKGETIEIPGVSTKRRDYWVGSVPGQSHEGAVPDIVAGQLMRYRNMVIA
ncbi:hypothetical protein [Hyphomicrobium sp. ghe19]|uniref:hypothetical protein n=1 Tax=Hyphomicrobium sp. ghe19 TaxID=2682968 RepID=UPI0030CF83F7